VAFSEATAAIRFAKAYVQLVEALMREGVAEDVARAQAGQTALVDARMDEADARDSRDSCPLCQKRE
jgi:hypothetical protein